jgi:hypothetical protein
MTEKSPLLKLAELLEENGFFFSKIEPGYYSSNGDELEMPDTIHITIHPRKKRFRWVSLDEKDSVGS